MKRRRERKGNAKIRLGPGGLVYVFVTALILGAAIYTQANLLFWAFGLMVGGLAVSILVAWQSMRALKVQRLLPSHGVCGEALPVRYHITNRSWLPVFSLMIQENWGRGGRGWKRVGPVADKPQRLRGRPHGWVLHLGPHQVIQAEALCWPLRRGRLSFERIVLSSSFPFGIIRKVVDFTCPGEVLVYPHLYRMNRRVLYSLSNLDPQGRKQVERAGGHEEFFGIRPYRYGDSLKLIDWKHTARTGDLVAREMTQPSPPRVVVLLDLTGAAAAEARSARGSVGAAAPANGRAAGNGHSAGNGKPAASGEGPGGLNHVEKAISLAASLVCDAHMHGYQIGLSVRGAPCGVFPVHHSLPHRTKMLEALASLDVSDADDGTNKQLERPSVVIWPGQGESIGGAGRGGAPAVLGAADLDRYVDLSGTTVEALDRRSSPVSRREEIEEAALARQGAADRSAGRRGGG